MAITVNSAQVTCKHCGLEFKPTEQNPKFCCNGCEYVYQAIQGEGLERFYALKEKTLPSVASSVFNTREYEWLKTQQEFAEQKSPKIAKLTLNIQGISCVACVWLIDKFFQKKQGAIDIEIYSQTGQIIIQWETGAFNIIEFARELQHLGYLLGPAKEAKAKDQSQLTTRMGLCAAFAMNAMLFTLPGYLGMPSALKLSNTFILLSFLCATFSLLIGGSYFLKRALFSLRQGIIHMDLPISLGVVLSYLGSSIAWYLGDNNYLYFDFTSIFIFLMLLGRWIQHITIERNNNQLLKLDPSPKFINIYSDENSLPSSATKYPINALNEGVYFSIKSGQINPVDALLCQKKAHFSLQSINGESEPKTFLPEQLIPAGAVYLGNQDIRLKSQENWSQSLLSQLTQKTKHKPYRNIALEKIIRYYTLLILSIAIIGGSLWYSASQNINLSLQITLAVLVVSCPCALGIALPITNERFVTFLKSFGVHIQNPSLFNKINNVKKIIFDKTGTLTHEVLHCQNPEVIKSLSAEQRSTLLELASFSLHPVSQALREELLTQAVQLKNYNPESMEEVIGAGVTKEINNETWSLIKHKKQGAYSTAFIHNQKVLAEFHFTENLRSDVKKEIQQLKKQGYEIYILSGDNQAKVMHMANQLDIPHSNAVFQASPQEKANWVQAIDNNDTLMVGDRANNSLIFEQAYCCATPVIDKGFLEHKSDFYFLGQGISGIRKTLESSKHRGSLYKILFGESILYNLAALSASLLGLVTPIVAAIIMPLSSLISIGLAYICFTWLNRENKTRMKSLTSI